MSDEERRGDCLGGRAGTGGSAGESCGLRRSDKTTSSLLNSPHWEPGGQGARRTRGSKGAGGEPGAAKNEKNCPARASGEVTAADISRIVAVSQSVSSSNYSGHRQRGGRLTEGGGGWGVSSGGQSD